MESCLVWTESQKRRRLEALGKDDLFFDDDSNNSQRSAK